MRTWARLLYWQRRLRELQTRLSHRLGPALHCQAARSRCCFVDRGDAGRCMRRVRFWTAGAYAVRRLRDRRGARASSGHAHARAHTMAARHALLAVPAGDGGCRARLQRFCAGCLPARLWTLSTGARIHRASCCGNNSAGRIQAPSLFVFAWRVPRARMGPQLPRHAGSRRERGHPAPEAGMRRYAVPARVR